MSDIGAVVENFNDYCELCDGITACQLGIELPKDASEAFRYGYQQEYAREQECTQSS